MRAFLLALLGGTVGLGIELAFERQVAGSRHPLIGMLRRLLPTVLLVAGVLLGAAYGWKRWGIKRSTAPLTGAAMGLGVPFLWILGFVLFDFFTRPNVVRYKDNIVLGVVTSVLELLAFLSVVIWPLPVLGAFVAWRVARGQDSPRHLPPAPAPGPKPASRT